MTTKRVFREMDTIAATPAGRRSSRQFFPVLVAAALVLGGCGELRRVVLGEKRSGPDESQVVEVPPLAIPPDFEMRPPTDVTESDRLARDERALRSGSLQGSGSPAERLAQIKAQAGGTAELTRIPEDVMEQYRKGKPVGARFGHYGDLELAAWMRKLDRDEPDYAN